MEKTIYVRQSLVEWSTQLQRIRSTQCTGVFSNVL